MTALDLTVMLVSICIAIAIHTGYDRTRKDCTCVVEDVTCLYEYGCRVKCTDGTYARIYNDVVLRGETVTWICRK